MDDSLTPNYGWMQKFAMADAKGLKKFFDAIFKTVNATTNELTGFVFAN